MTLTKAKEVAKTYARHCFDELCAIHSDDWPKALEDRYQAAYKNCMANGLNNSDIFEGES